MMTTPIPSLHQERCASQSPRVVGQSRGHLQGEALPPVTTRSASPVIHEVLRRMRLSPTERQVLTVLTNGSPAPVSDEMLLEALDEAWHVPRLHTCMQSLRSKLRPHGITLVRAFNYGYLLIEEAGADTHERMIAP
jgi:DNA-binding response OmpR family regulator